MDKFEGIWGRHKVTIVTFGFLLLIFLISMGIFSFSNNLSDAVGGYKGDGIIKDITWKFAGIMPILGYSVDFQDFDLSRSYKANYSLTNLPKDLHRVGVYLLIKDKRSNWPDERKKTVKDAHVIIKIKDAEGRLIKEVNQLLKDMWWADENGGLGAYDLDNSFFEPKDGAGYILEVEYQPGIEFEGIRGNIYIRAGGSI